MSGISYTCGMSTSAADAKARTKSPLRLGTLVLNPGLFFLTLFRGRFIGRDNIGNQYFERPGKLRARRWVVYGGAADPSSIGPEWHAWLHHLTDAPLVEAAPKPWRRKHLPNLTGTPASYRPAGHDYEGGKRAKASADYEAWTPDQA